MQDVPRLKTPKARFSAKSRLVVEGREDSAYLLSPAKAGTAKEPDKHDRKEGTFQIPAHQQDSWQHLQPSVMAPYETSATSAPREILIHRKRKLYAMQDVEELLAKEGLDRGQPFTGSEQHLDGMLPLAIFDDTEYESRDPQGWVCKEPGAPAAPGRVAIPSDDGSHTFQDCTVQHQFSTITAHCIRCCGTADIPTQDWVPRIRLCFLSEDPALYAKRVAVAHQSRIEAVKAMRYHLCVDSMPADDMHSMSVEQINRVLTLALNSKFLRERLSETHPLVNEAITDYARAMNKITFDHAVKTSSSGVSGLAMVPLDSTTHQKSEARQVPHCASVAVPAYSFPEKFSSFSFLSLLTKAEVIAALVKVRAECNKIGKMSLFNAWYTKSTAIEEFEIAQNQTLDQAGNGLRDNWVTAVQLAFKSSFKDVGKGWYNLNESNYETYCFSKMKSLLVVTRFMMEDTLRSLVLDNHSKYVTFVNAACGAKVTVVDTSNVQIVYPAATTASTQKPPLLGLELQVSEGTKISCKTDLDSVVPRMLALFDKAITVTQGIPQMEPLVMEGISWAFKPVLESIHPQEPQVLTLRESIASTLTAALMPVRQYIAKAQAYETWLAVDPTAYVDALQAKSEELSLSEVQAEINKHQRELVAMQSALPASINLGFTALQLVKVRDLIISKKQRLIRSLKEALSRVPRRIVAAVAAKFGEVEKRLRLKPSNIEEVADQRQFIDALPRKVAELIAEMDAAQGWYGALENMRYSLPDEDAREKAAGEAWPTRIERFKEAALSASEAETKKYEEVQQSEQSAFQASIVDMDQAVASMQSYTEMSAATAVAEKVSALAARLKQAEKDAALYNSREALFGKPATDYSQVRKLWEGFEPYQQFWSIAAAWKEHHKAWTHDAMNKLDGEAVEKEVASNVRTMHKTGKAFAQRGLQAYATNCETIKAEIEDFQKAVPLLVALRQPGMRERHWQQLSEQLGMTLKPDKDFVLSKALDMHLMDHLDTIQKVSEVAGKESSIEVALDKMAAEWATAEISVLEYRNTGTFVIKLDEAVLQQLDDHIVMTQSMAFSPYKKPFEERLMRWEAQLSLVSEVIDEWLALQRAWMYLEPIFSSPDILQQLPQEGKKYSSVDRIWRKTMQAAKATPGILKMCGSQKLLDQLTECNKLLESVQKGLSDYLETKRLAFARFFFLSNDELLQILSQSKNPHAVQPHLRKCFEAIESLDISDSLEVTAMTSKEKERVPFDTSMQASGPVELWLGEVERRMKSSVRAQTQASLLDYTVRARPEWVRKWPAMAVLAVSAICWSQMVEEGIRASSVPAVLQKCVNDLLDLTDLVRGKLGVQDRLTLGALITLDVHARDVVQQLVDASVTHTTDFEWASQLRYYWRDNVWVEMVQACIAYGYEYLGNTPRLVITPLTDRCYITLMSAMHLNLGGAPAGPAGTGKTETTKDLAKALAKQCVVFNCSDGLDYIAMGKFFKGLASSGAWACFDEFNRIDLEVLSVVAQQILTIQLAIQAKVKRFVFEDTEIELDPSCTVYITMNPGYAGRSELPDNLKALFRPCAMMVPDYALIAEICLYSYGYRNAKPLAQKMVATFKLCSEQLSAQDHYDYGMRAVKSTITAVGNLKRDHPEEGEEVLLLRGLRDVNVPKFLAHDLPLFDGIITDLFPGVQPPKVDYGDLLQALGESCQEMGLQAVDSFVAKCIQLYETTLVRHGLMLVGPTMGGKTACYRALQKAMIRLNETGRFEKVRVVALNPKSITMGQLYGEFDENTHEWTDGVLATYMRECCADTRPDKKWIMFDGPVDAIWIENMNTVLDDNKKLCLVSGEIIQLSDSMTMMFEVEDLAVASPATVSRCGMVYMEPTSTGLQPLATSWLDTLPPGAAEGKELLGKLWLDIVPEAVHFVRRHLKEPVTTVDNALVASCFSIMDALLKPYVRQEGQEPLSAEEVTQLKVALPSFLLFAITWSMGASCDKTGRIAFDLFLKSKAAGVKAAKSAVWPSEKTIYDWCYSQETAGWVDWMATVPPYVPDPDAFFSQIIVPTSDTVRYNYLLKILALAGKHVLLVGATGTGKTLNITQQLTNGLPAEMVPVFLTFSARTSANQTQDIIDSKMDKRRKGVFGPPAGQKYVIFVDDLNMPQREKYFAQPPIELLRQWLDHKGWYERRPPCAFKQIIDTQFVAAMGPPGGGRNPITNRLLRHFNLLAMTDMSDESCRRIFTTILGSFVNKYFNEQVSAATTAVVDSTIEVYNQIREQLLPTPSKPHYTFNLRDVARVIQGVMRADPKTTTEPRHIILLWLHEAHRVFADRLINADDTQWFRDQTKILLGKHFNSQLQEVLTTDRLVFGDYLVPGADPRVYTQVTDMERLVKVVEEYLEDYNSASSAPMRLVMFLDAVEHVSRVSRVIRLPRGHALLLGVGGSGRQSLTRLAAHMQDFEVYQIEISKGYGRNEWRDDMKKLLKRAGLEAKQTVFLFTDTQIIHETFLEDINNILNSGEVPNLMRPEDLEEISGIIRPVLQAQGRAPTKLAIQAAFVDRVQQHLHLVLCMSPIGDAFRQRLRMFPALVNCCTIDWFREWPAEALTSVATSFFQEVPLNNERQPDLQTGVIACCSAIHQSVERNSVRYFEELRRHNYVTPASYLELLTTFIKLLAEKRKDIGVSRQRLEAGLSKLLTTAAQVEVMQAELRQLQPVLERTAVDVEAMMVRITADKKEAAATQKAVAQQEQEANEQAARAKAMADDAQRDLDEALPALEAATASLKNLSRNDVVEVKSLSNPPAGVKMVMEACCIMFDEKPKMVEDPVKMGKKMPSYWDAAKRLLADPTKFLDSLITFDKDNIKDAIIQRIQPYIDMEEFTPEAVARVSKACTSICMWVRAMYKYHTVALSVAPKRAALAQAQSQLDATLAELAAAQAKLQAVEANIHSLESEYSEATAKKESLAQQVAECTVKLTRAEKLIGGLGGEKSRWQATVEQLALDMENVVGDVVVAAGCIAYSGPFTPAFRQLLQQEWTALLKAASVPHTPDTNLIDTLQEPQKAREWNLAGLPSDSTSLENGIIVSKARRWPLMIDPQGQANKWIKAMEKAAGLEVVKMSDKDFLRTLENGVRFGRPILAENVGEVLEAALEPLLLKQTFKQGGSEVIKIGDNVVPYHPDFRFYMTSKLANPHYPPEVSVKVSLLNFFVTPEGLEEQLLDTTVFQERPDLSEMKSNLMVNNARMKAELSLLEDTILQMLSASQGNILDDENLINTLAVSKATSNDIASKVEEAERTEQEIDAAREQYRSVAVRASLLFFCIADLAGIDPMYQYSLAWFDALFLRTVQATPDAESVEERSRALNEAFTYALFINVCRSLFEAHKLMFSFLLAIKILQNRKQIDPVEWRFLLSGVTPGATAALPNPAPRWLTDKSWTLVLNLAALPAFQGLATGFAEQAGAFQAIFDSNEAHEMPLPEPWNTRLNSFQKLAVIRCLRPDKVSLGIQSFVAEHLGSRFTEPPPFNLAGAFQDSSNTTPLIFVLSPGADPMADLLKLADELRFAKKFEKVSLGQGQGPKAEKVLIAGMEKGQWVCLQNCHLAVSWMPSLERIVEGIGPDTCHKDFRLWLTSMPSPGFPAAVLQRGVKMTLEPPKGLKSNMLRTYTRFSEAYLHACAKPSEWRRLLFGLSLFHAVVQDRRKFGPLGWNIRYDFTDGDLGVSLTQMRMFLDEYADIPFKVLRFLVTEINYGGRVTDDKDRRLINNLVSGFVGPQVLDPGYKFSASGAYESLDLEMVTDYVEAIKEFPAMPKPEIFGLHENADITCDQNETYNLFSTILALQPRVSGGGGASREDTVLQLCETINAKVAAPFDVEQLQRQYPATYQESMNTVLVQEALRYNALLEVVAASLKECAKAVKGLVVMSPSLEAVSNSMYDNQVPELWASKAYPSLKPLSSWVNDLQERVQFIQKWAQQGTPPVYWISGFFFPQAFLTGTVQNFARKNAFAIDTVSFEFQVMDQLQEETCTAGPSDGCYIKGLYIEGARWDSERHMLAESRPKELFTEMPIVWLKPVQHRNSSGQQFYNCPMYKTLTRAGTLSTTGHSTNFVMFIELPSDLSESHWINRGVALFTSLDF
ncbi:hypothetical protein WJX77_000912 [Trebouxia sp. C0004]